MRRREFVSVICGAAAWPLTVGAQQPDRIRRISDFVAELLQDESLDIRLIVNGQDVHCHAVRSTRVSISLRSITKSIGLVRSASAPPSSALRFVSASP
jgi:hypothetical protein